MCKIVLKQRPKWKKWKSPEIPTIKPKNMANKKSQCQLINFYLERKKFTFEKFVTLPLNFRKKDRVKAKSNRNPCQQQPFCGSNVRRGLEISKNMDFAKKYFVTSFFCMYVVVYKQKRRERWSLCVRILNLVSPYCVGNTHTQNLVWVGKKKNYPINFHRKIFSAFLAISETVIIFYNNQ